MRTNRFLYFGGFKYGTEIDSNSKTDRGLIDTKKASESKDGEIENIEITRYDYAKYNNRKEFIFYKEEHKIAVAMIYADPIMEIFDEIFHKQHEAHIFLDIYCFEADKQSNNEDINNNKDDNNVLKENPLYITQEDIKTKGNQKLTKEDDNTFSFELKYCTKEFIMMP